MDEFGASVGVQTRFPHLTLTCHTREGKSITNVSNHIPVLQILAYWFSL